MKAKYRYFFDKWGGLNIVRVYRGSECCLCCSIFDFNHFKNNSWLDIDIAIKLGYVEVLRKDAINLLKKNKFD